MNSIYSLPAALRLWLAKRPQQFRFVAVLFALFLGMLSYTAHYVLAQTSGVSLTTKVTFANGGDMMDVGNAWNGTAKVGGELFELTIKNNTSGTITNLQPTVELSSGLEYVAGSASPGTVTQSGQVLTFSNINSLAVGASVTVQYRVRAGNNAISGTYDLESKVTYTDGANAPQTTPEEIFPVKVAEGFSVITKTPDNQLVAINGQVTWDVSVTNTGLGGLFDVQIVEMANTPELAIGQITQTAPTSLTAAQNGRTFTLPYLAPEETFTLKVTGTVIACGNIVNTATTNDLTGRTSKEYTASVLLDLEVPLIEYTAPAISLNYSGTTPVSVPVKNAGNGTARAVALETNLHQLPVSVTNVSSNWTYVNGKFTLTANGGTLGHEAIQTLSFNIELNDVCTDNSAMTVVWTAQYTNDCGDIYAVPTEIGTISPPANTPTVSLSKSVSDARLNIGESGTFNLTLSATNSAQLSGNVAVIDDLSGIIGHLDSVTVGSASAGTAFLDTNTNIITWTVPASALNNTQTLEISFQAENDPCGGGEILTNTASFTATTTANCSLIGSASASVLIGNPVVALPTQNYNVDGSIFETGASATSGTRAAGEGEFIPVISSYSFAAGQPGKFVGSTYGDDFGGLGILQTLVPNSLQVKVDGGGAQTVPSSAVTIGSNGLNLNLGFLAGAGFASDENVAGHSFEFTYQTTIADAALPAGAARSITQRSTLTLADGSSAGGGCQDTRFIQGDFYAIARAEAAVAISVQQNIERCVVFPITVTVNNPSGYTAHNVKAEIDLDDKYRLDSVDTLTGALIGATVDITTDPEKPTVTLANPLAAGASGTVTLQVSLKANAAISPIPGIRAHIDYNDNETQSTFPQVFADNATGRPAVVRSANIKSTVTPQNISVVSERVEWHVYVLNTGNGKAVNLKLSENIPAGFVLDQVATNTANGGDLVSLIGQTATWELPELAPGGSRLVKVIADINPNGGAVCSIIGTQADITATWGCGSAEYQTIQTASPNFVFPDGALQVLHDTTRSYFELCGEGSVTIIVRNVGKAYAYDAEVSDKLVGALQYVSGSTEYSTDSGNTWIPSPNNPSTSGNTLTWTKTQIAVLEKLAPQSATSGVNRIRIRFKVKSDETLSNNPTLPKITASVKAQTGCGAVVDSPGAAFALPARRPIINVEKEGRNTTVNPTGSFGKTVYGGVGDVVQWKVTVSNASPHTEAGNVRLKEAFAGSGATNMTVVGDSPSTVNTTMTGNGIITLDNIPAGETRTYIITETLGATCVNAENTSSITWGCTDQGANVESLVHYPGNNSDKAQLNTLPDLSSSAVTHTITSLPNGRLKGEVKIKNNGGTGKNLEFTLSLDALPSMALDASVLPEFSSVSGGVITGGVLTSSGTDHVYTFNAGEFRNGEDVSVTYYLIQTGNFDENANGGAASNLSSLTPDNIKAFQYPETEGNGLDPALPVAGAIDLKVDIDSTCDAPITRDITTTVNPLTPDLDIRVAPSSQVVQTGAVYTLGFDFYIKNNGRAGSIAENITFRLPEIGTSWSSVTITGPNGETATGTPGSNPVITLDNSIAAGNEVRVQVKGTTIAIPSYGADPGGDVGLRLIGEVVGRLHNQSGADTDNNYSFDRAAPAISSDVNVAGYVYLDANTNAQRDSGENGIGSPPVLWAKLVPAGGAAAIKVVEVDPTSGAYLFTVVADDEYSIVISDDNDANNINPADLSAYGYIGTENPGLVRSSVIVGNTSLSNLNFGLYKGSRVTGTVFKDDGIGGGTANDGVQNGAETGIPNVTVRALDSSDNLLATATTGVDGKYELIVPAVAGAVRIVQSNLNGYISTGADVGTSGGVYDRNADTITLDPFSADYAGLDFGDVPQSTFTLDGNKTVFPGGTVQFPHVFTAQTDGEVSFSSVAADLSPYVWTHSLYRDMNSNGILDPGETVLTGPITVTTGQEVHIIVRVFAPATVTQGMEYKVLVNADFELDTATPAITQNLTRTDITIVNEQQKLTLEKSVDKANADRGDDLIYTITYRNDTDKPLTALVINDAVPAYTEFVSAGNGPLSSGLTNVVVTNPVAPGETAIKWSFVGTLEPGEEGTVTFTVKVQ